jgi:glycosyltransferase A (GT-A) superfamily protein (DUF2064 family)
MYRDAERNWDRKALAADHSIARSTGLGTLADRLLHSTCNNERQDGKRDHLRPALTGRPIDQADDLDELGALAMPWP